MWIRAALFILILPAGAAAQEPLSAIEWLRQNPPPDFTSPVLSEPPVTDTVAPPRVDVSPLEALAAPIGLVPAEVTGLPPDLWLDGDVARLARQIAAVPVRRSPAMQALLYTLLLTEATPPRTASDAETLLLARIDRLLALGATDAAQALAEQANPATSKALFSRWFDATLLTGDEDRACAVLAKRPHLAPNYAASIYCDARRGDWQMAALTLEAAHALELLPPARLDRLDRFLSPDIFDGAPPLPAPEDPDPLDFRLLEAIGEPLPTAALPRVFATADLRDTAGWKAQLEAAERLTGVGALSPNRLLGLYTERRPAASGGIWDRVAALQRFETALETRTPSAVAKTLPDVWRAMREAGLEVSFATLFADALAAQPLPDPAAAALAYRIRLLSPDYEAASATPPDGAAAFAFWAALAQGNPAHEAAPDPVARAIAEGFSAPAPNGGASPADLLQAPDARPLGAAILRAMALFDSGARGNAADLTRALAMFRALGLEDSARRAALQVLLLGRDRQ